MFDGALTTTLYVPLFSTSFYTFLTTLRVNWAYVRGLVTNIAHTEIGNFRDCVIVSLLQSHKQIRHFSRGKCASRERVRKFPRRVIEFDKCELLQECHRDLDSENRR